MGHFWQLRWSYPQLSLACTGGTATASETVSCAGCAYKPRQCRTASSTRRRIASEARPAGASAKRLGSIDRNWKHRKTVSIGRPLSVAGTRTFTPFQFAPVRTVFPDQRPSLSNQPPRSQKTESPRCSGGGEPFVRSHSTVSRVEVVQTGSRFLEREQLP